MEIGARVQNEQQFAARPIASGQTVRRGAVGSIVEFDSTGTRARVQFEQIEEPQWQLLRCLKAAR